MQFWPEERSLTILLVLPAINMFVLDLLIREGMGIAFMRSIFFSLLLLAGLLTVKIEAFLGQLYPAILIARLVALQIEARKKDWNQKGVPI